MRQDEKLDQKSSKEVKTTKKLLSILEQLLHGTFRVSSTGREYIEVGQGEETRKISLEKMASGQSQITGLWPALIEFVYTQTHGAFFFIDEPEAHLYPRAQQQVVNALALTLNTTPGNQMLINTHSPYIMTAFDNLITAAETAKERPDQADKVKEIVPEDMWIAYDRVSAIYLDDGEAITGDEDSEPGTILDQERRSLSGSRFDRSGDAIEKIFGELLEIRYPIEEDA